MRRPYDPARPDPLGIHAEVERERLASRFRDGCSRGKVHPYDHDLGCLIDFCASRRRRQPDVMNLLRRVLHSVDPEAIRLLVDIVLTKGSYDHYMELRCQRLLKNYDAVEFAMAVKKEYDRLAAPLQAEIAANEAETAELKLLSMPTDPTTH